MRDVATKTSSYLCTIVYQEVLRARLIMIQVLGRAPKNRKSVREEMGLNGCFLIIYGPFSHCFQVRFGTKKKITSGEFQIGLSEVVHAGKFISAADFLQTRDVYSFDVLRRRPCIRQRARSPRDVCRLARAQRDASEMIIKNFVVPLKPSLPGFIPPIEFSPTVSTQDAAANGRAGYLSESFDTFSSQFEQQQKKYTLQ